MTIKNLTNSAPLPPVNIHLLLQENNEKTLQVDKGILALLGYNANDFLDSKLKFSELIHADDHDIVIGLFSPESQELPKRVNFRCRQAHGKIICLKASYQKQYNKSADILTIHLQLTDVKSLQQPLNEQLLLNNFTAMMENSVDYIYFKDRNHVFTEASQNLVSLTDPSEHWTNLIGKTDYDIFPEAYADDYYGLEKQVFSGEVEVAQEVQKIIDPEGHHGWVDNRKYPIKDKSGNIIGLFGIARDITKSKFLDQALKENGQRFRTIFNDAPLGVTVVDSLTGYIYDANPAFAKIAGRTIEELKTIDWMTITHPDDVQEDLDNMALLNAGKISGFNMQKRFIQPDGSIRWVKITIASIQLENKSKTRHLCMTEDITQSKNIEQSLRQSEERYGYIFENSLTEIFIFAADTYKFIKVNSGACINIGYTFEELRELTPLDIIPELTLKQYNDLLETLRTDKKKILQFETVHQRKNGTLYSVEVHLQLIDFVSKPAFVAIILDISDRKIAEEKLQLSAKVFSETNEGISITDSKGIIRDVNPSFCEITGYARLELIGQNSSILGSGKQNPAFYAGMWQALKKLGHWQGEIWNRKKAGELYAVLLSISSILDEQGNTLYYVGIFTDITHSKKQQETLEQMAHYDVLTQLPNRVLLADRFIQALAHSKRQKNMLAVCFLDLDNFKPINDLYGHETGDTLLIEVSERIKTNIRAEDTVSRQGGDEFVLLLGDIKSFSQCEQTLKRIIESLAQPYIIDEQDVSISASVGVTLYPIDDADFDTLIRHADQAMYQAKLAGRNRFYLFNTEQDHQGIQKAIQLKEIEQAFLNNELCLYYQPKVNMQTGQVFGTEALIRWNHPEKGLIPSLKFLAVIEETELEIQVGNWVINEALQQLNSWKEQDIELEVSVNISSYHLQSPSFVVDLEKILALYPNVDSRYLQLEILESSALGDHYSISSVIKTCIKALGLNFALDDFGTGYSSLTHLRNLAAKTIKIDQTFVRDMLDDPSDYAIIDGIIGLADSFNRDVIAEGVETREHALMLLAMGCHKAQGYAISRPIPADDFPAWLFNFSTNNEWKISTNTAYTSKEKKVQLFRLSLKRWQNNFASHIQSLSENINHWPILEKTKCHCGVLIRRAREEQLFETSCLDKLDEAHNSMHYIADDLYNKYQQGEVENARDGLEDIQGLIEQMYRVLEQCE